MQIVSTGDNLHEMSKLIFLEKEEEISTHYENTPIQIYWEFFHQKMKNFSDEKF